MTQSKIDKIKNLVKEGNKLAAVKVLMDSADINLKDAKDIIDNFALGKISNLEQSVATAKNRYTDNYGRISATCDPDGTNVHFYYQKGQVKEEELQSIIREKGKLPAIKFLKDKTEIGLKEAMEIVEEASRGEITDLEARIALEKEKLLQANQEGGANISSKTYKQSPFFDVLRWYFVITLALAVFYFLYTFINDILK